MKDKYQDDIHNATPERLAEMLEEIANSAKQYAIQTAVNKTIMDAVVTEYNILYEAAHRIRETAKPTYNDERRP
jgi:hypothetical protein